MKLTSSASLMAPLLASIIGAAAVPNVAAEPDVAGVKSKVTKLFQVREAADILKARAPVTGTVNGDGVKYRTCPNTSSACPAQGQYNWGQQINIICRAQGESVDGWNWWDKMDNGYWISDYYVAWTGGTPDICP